MTLAAAKRDLLEATCATGDRAFQAWARWSAGADLDHPRPGEYALLPLAFRNLEPHAPPGTLFRKAGAIYRQTWLANQVILRGAVELGGALAARGIDYAVAGSAALAVTAFPDPGARPIAGIDLLVDEPRLSEAIEAVAAPGFAPARLYAQLAPGATRRFAAALLAAAAPRPVGSASIRVLAPADLLLQACERISAWDQGPGALALADAWKLLGTLQDDDWTRLLEQARRERVTLTVRTALAQLEQLGAGPLPAGAMRELAGAVPGLLERLEFRLKIRAFSGRGVSLLVLRHLRARAAGDRDAGLPQLPRRVLGHVAARLRERTPPPG